MILKLDKLRCLALFVLLIPAMAMAQEQNHIVKRGDTLYSIGRMYGMTVREIQEKNNLDSSNLSIGQVLKVKAEPQAAVSTPASPPPPPSAIPPAAAPAQSAEESDQDPPRPIQRSSLPEDYFYQIQRGDNLFRIAKNHNISLPDMLQWNGFANADVAIYPGQRLVVKDPAAAPVSERTSAAAPTSPRNPDLPSISAAPPDTVMIEKVYIVQPKDTLFKIARENNMTVDALKRLNSITSNDIRVGQRIYLAGSPRPAGTGQSSANITEEELMKKDRLREDLALPVEGRVLSEYGLRNGRPHKGIDIGAKNGTPIYAVLDGTVVYSGVQGAYGNVVVLEHPDFVMTVYAHNEKNMVAVGDKVQKGQQIATVGSTGNASGSHLHFEYRIKGKAINPRKVLPLR
jgi:murein DD-endopeptidase MepM/ murein hydrolase activator NlpD